MTDFPTGDAPSTPGRRCWTLVGDLGALDVEVTAACHHRIADVLPVVSDVVGRRVDGLWAGTTHLADDTPLSAAVLDHGAVLGVGRPVRGRHPDRASSALELRVVGGPDAGRSFPLGQGPHVVGRSGGIPVRLDDPDVSRRHAAVHVGGGGVTVTDLGSSNGSLLDGVDLGAAPRNWPPGAVLRLGTSALVLAGPEAPATRLDAGPDGRRRMRTVPRMSAPPPEVDVRFPRPPAEVPRRRLAWVAVTLPAVGGVTMAWLLDAPMFLFFALLGPVVALGTWWSERWSGRRSGRQQAAAHAREVRAAEERLRDAVRADVRASETAHPDLATLAVAACRRTQVLWSRSRDDAEALAVRVGTGPGTTRVVRIDDDGTRTRETAPHLPVVVDLRSTGGLAVVGPRERAAGVLFTVLAQLSALHPPGELDLLLLVAADRLSDWSWSRWLPHLDAAGVQVLAPGPGPDRPAAEDGLHARLAALTAGRPPIAPGRPEQPPGWLVVVVDGALDARSATVLRAARATGVLVLAAADGPGGVPVDVDAVLQLTGETGDTGVLRRRGLPDRGDVAVDRLPARLAATLARDLAALVPVATDSVLPRRVRLLEVAAAGRPPDTGREHDVPVSWTRARDRLVAPLGRTAHGPLTVDLCHLGPHALIAGTTGSGKSELLQTLVAGLALNHPPDRCSLLLVDYKGGAAFAEAAALPHTVGMVTDLDRQTTARALRSLAAELTRREGILAAHGVADIAVLPESAELARLVIVVDEFAGLSEELPDFVPGLVAIAQRGRSLGVHLVLATQRPSGVVSPEIRANCNLRICLRTTDESESRDVLGTPHAAHLPLDAPGRAWLRSGSGTPVALQVARVAGHAPAESGTAPSARRWTWPLPGPREEPRERDDRSDLDRIRRTLDEHCRTAGVPHPHRPWRPPLPDRIPPGTLDDRIPSADVGRTAFTIGLVDRPDLQSQEVLRLDLEDGGTWLAVGGPRSGRTTLLRTVLAEAVRTCGPEELHVHVLEAGTGTLGTDATLLPHTGTIVSGEDALRTVRLVDRLAQEVAGRRAGSGHDAKILLLVDGVEAISTVLDEFDPGRGSANLLRLMRDGTAVGLTCVATADRAVPGGRLAAVARQRLVLPLPDRADYAVAGIAARDVPTRRTPGRALVGEEARECQLVLPRPVDLGAPLGERRPEALRIVELPPDPWLPLPARDPSPTAPGAGTGLRLTVGPGGDEGRPLTVDLVRTGGLLVSGPAGSGRSSALAAFAHDLSSRGVAVLLLGRAWAVLDGAPSVPGAVTLHPADEAGTAEWLDGLAGRPGVLVADDMGTPQEVRALTRLTGDHRGVALIGAANAGELSAHYQGPVAALRRGRAGLLLCPGPGDADLFGLRLPRTALPERPGSGWLVAGGHLQRVQVARRRIAAAPAPENPPATRQSSSSAEPISCRAYQASS